jgi:hypothetical protein
MKSLILVLYGREWRLNLRLGFNHHDFRKILLFSDGVVLISNGYAVICLPFVPVRIELGHSAHVSSFCFDISAH